MNAILLASVGVVILLIGGGIGYWFGRTGVGGSKARIEKAEADLEDYKRNVTEHFGQTAEHFQAIGKQYRELYEHMAQGAQVLCEPDEAGKQLSFAPGAIAAKEAEMVDDGIEVADSQPPADYAEPAIDDDVIEGEPIEPTVEVLAEEESADDDAGESVSEDEELTEVSAEPKPDEKTDDAERTIH